MNALVIGGTGPTGPFIVEGLLARGFEVAILHRGTHEIDEIPAAVEHIHTDPYDAAALRSALGDRRFDVTIAAYGRLRAIAEIFAGRTERFISIGGFPLYRGYFDPERLSPPGLPAPTAEDAPLVESEAELHKGYRMRLTEEAVFRHHPRATHLRYPFVYGPRQLVPREWSIVRRILDGRPHIILPDGGLTLTTYGYAENLAHAVMLAVEQPEAAAGRVYNCGDDEVLTLRQVTEIVAAALEHRWEIVSVPWEVALPARPMVMQPLPTHRLIDTSRIRNELGYRDRVPPAEALGRTARWYVDNPPPPGGEIEQILEDPFDYRAEDELVALASESLKRMGAVRFEREPGYGLAYADARPETKPRGPIG